MQANKGSGTKPELMMARAIEATHPASERRCMRLNAKGLPGSPDFAFEDVQVAVFVDGCYWHSCPRHGSRPKSNRKFWREKFDRNRKRDARNNSHLKDLGWTVLRVWECRLKKDPTAAAEWVRRQSWAACRRARAIRPRVVRMRPA